MIKKIIKFLSIIFLLVFILTCYLSIVGIKTERFNERIKSNILKNNKKIKLDLKDFKLLLNPYNFTAIISTKNPIILISDEKLEIESIKTNISLKSLIFNEFSIDDVQVSTKPIRLKDVILLAKSFKNSTELFILNKVIKSGFLVADIKLKFDEDGKIKKDFQINGFIKNVNLNFLNQLNVKNLNFNFEIYNKKYSLTDIKTEINNIKLSSSLIDINEEKDLFFVKGKVITSKKDYRTGELSEIFSGLFENKNIEKVKFSSENNFSFNISKKVRLKLNDLNVVSKVNIEELIVNNKFINLKPYLPNSNKIINFKNHKISINYNKNQFKINGEGSFLLKDKSNSIKYQVIKNKDRFIFDTKIKIKDSKLLIDFLDYKKKENLNSTILIKGNFKKNDQIKFDLISLIEKNNKISFKNLNLSEDFKIISIDAFDFNYLNNKNIKNQLVLKKNKLDYVITGKIFDATKLINVIMNNEDKNPSLFENFNSKIDIKIKKTFIDDTNFINNLSGTLNFKDSKIYNLNLKSVFPNNKNINLVIKTNNQKEKITQLFTNHPKPIIKRYNFIKGFEEGYLDYYSIKKDGNSNSRLIIDNFKVKEVPVFAKILSLASLQGVADLLTGEGIRFTDFEMKFSNKTNLTTIEEMYAIGPAVSILMDGYIDSNKLISLSGTLVPATTINRSIASIPIFGDILIGKKTGEGVFGVSFKIKGPPKNLKTTVNPIKTLTPRFITRTLEKIKKN